MQLVPSGDATENSADTVDAADAVDARRTRRTQMRQHARELRPSTPSGTAPMPRNFATPEWLDRSFVLPLTQPEAPDMPSQPSPHHDDDQSPAQQQPSAGPVGAPSLSFVRPPSPEIDFAKVIRRSDHTRAANRAALGSTGLAGVLLIAFLLNNNMVILLMAVAFALVAVVAVVLRLRLATATVPHV